MIGLHGTSRKKGSRILEEGFNSDNINWTNSKFGTYFICPDKTTLDWSQNVGAANSQGISACLHDSVPFLDPMVLIVNLDRIEHEEDTENFNSAFGSIRTLEPIYKNRVLGYYTLNAPLPEVYKMFFLRMMKDRPNFQMPKMNEYESEFVHALETFKFKERSLIRKGVINDNNLLFPPVVEYVI